MERRGNARHRPDRDEARDLEKSGDSAEDPEAEEMIEDAFPTVHEHSAPDLSRGRVFAIIPEEVIEAGPEYFASYLEKIFEAGPEAEEAIEKLAEQHSLTPPGAPPVEIVVPAGMLENNPGGANAFLDTVFDAFDEIDEVLSELVAAEGPRPDMRMAVRTVVVTEKEVADPARLLMAVDRIRDEAGKLELIFRQAKHMLKRLNRFRLSRLAPGTLVSEMRAEGEFYTLQYLVEFLHSIHVAADSFERLEIPRPHIRDYLEFLYQMEDWEAMGLLVRRLERAVRRFSNLERGGS